MKRSKAAEFNSSKGWFENFTKGFGSKNVRVTAKAASVAQEAGDKFPCTIKTIVGENKYLPQEVFNVYSSALFGK